MVRSTLSALLLAAAFQPVSSAEAQRVPGAEHVNVVANDYAFRPIPTTLPAGLTVFSFADSGKVPHEVAIARMKKGSTVDGVMQLVKAGSRIRDLTERSVGILVATPGRSPEGGLVVNLIEGETYLVYCNFRDTPEAPQHTSLGMYTSFRAGPPKRRR